MEEGFPMKFQPTRPVNEKRQRIRPRAAAWATFIGLLTLPSLLSGCEFGNHSETTLSGYDVISGYYSTLPQSIAFRAQVGLGAPRTKSGLVAEIPDFLKTVMDNPTMLYFDDPLKGWGSIRSRVDTSLGIPTTIDLGATTFAESTSAYAEVAGCQLTQDIVHSGGFSQLPSTQVISGVTVRGTLSLDYALDYTLIGMDVDCDPMRDQMKDCYANGLNCATDPASIFYQPFLQEVFDPYVNAGLMTADEIATVRSVGYTAVYR